MLYIFCCCRCAALCQCCRERKFHIIGFQSRALAPPHATDSFSIGNTTTIIGMKLNFPFPSQQPAHTIRAPRLVRYRLIRLCNKHFYFSITRVNLAVDAAICKLCLRKTTQHSNLGTTKTSMRLPCRRCDDATLSYLIAATLSLLSLICEIDSKRRAQIDSELKLNLTEKTGREFQNDLGTWESEINSLSSCYRRPGTTWWNFKLTFGIIIIDIHISATRSREWRNAKWDDLDSWWNVSFYDLEMEVDFFH